VQLNYLERGEGPPVILIHGLFGSAGNLGMVARGLAPHFHAYSLDVRNHGRSPHSDDMNYKLMAADVIQFMDDRAITSCPILGHSMGGKIAMQVALDHPGRVSRLVVADVAPVNYPPHHEDTLAGLEAVDQASISSRAQADEILSQWIEEPGVRAFLLKSLQQDDSGLYHWLLNRRAITANYAALGAAAEGHPFAGPTLFIKGGNSDYILPKHRARVMQLFPSASLKVIEGAGHWLHAEKPTLFNQLVLRFLQQSEDAI
jgi:esterase